MDRITAERQFHDRQARQRERSFQQASGASLCFTDADYLDHESWIRPAFAALGPLAGRRVLDYGCGHGMAAVVLARQGALVTAFDLSAGYVRETLRRAQANGVTLQACTANAEALPFADASFDLVWGSAILHHLDLPTALRELRRVLTPQGRAVFCEPWGGNPFLEFARRSLPYPGKQRTADERPLRPRDWHLIRRFFPQAELQGYQLLGMLRRVWSTRGRVTWLESLDGWLLRRWPRLKIWCRYVVLTLPMA